MTPDSLIATFLPVKRVSIGVDEEVARWLRSRATERGTSVSRLVAEMLHEKMKAEQYEAAKRAYFAVRPVLFSSSGGYPSRDEIHRRKP